MGAEGAPPRTPPSKPPPPPPLGASGRQLVGAVAGVQDRGVAPPVPRPFSKAPCPTQPLDHAIRLVIPSDPCGDWPKRCCLLLRRCTAPRVHRGRRCALGNGHGPCSEGPAHSSAAARLHAFGPPGPVHRWCKHSPGNGHGERRW